MPYYLSFLCLVTRAYYHTLLFLLLHLVFAFAPYCSCLLFTPCCSCSCSYTLLLASYCLHLVALMLSFLHPTDIVLAPCYSCFHALLFTLSCLVVWTTLLSLPCYSRMATCALLLSFIGWWALLPCHHALVFYLASCWSLLLAFFQYLLAPPQLLLWCLAFTTLLLVHYCFAITPCCPTIAL
jgi:hypothetical protein